MVPSLPAAELAVARVAERVRQGGHHVPDHVVRRRFHAGLNNLLTCYPDAVDSWQVYDNAGLTAPRLVASGAHGASDVVVDWNRWNHLKASS